MYPNSYLRSLNAMDMPPDHEWPMWKEEGDIIILPDGYRWRIERTPTVADLVHPGDIIKISYGKGNGISGERRVAKVVPFPECTCPVIGYFDKLCDGNYRTEATAKYHRVLTYWTIVMVPMNAIPNKDGTFKEKDYGWVNDLVAVGERILHQYENNDEEVFVVNKKRRKKLAPFQPELL